MKKILRRCLDVLVLFPLVPGCRIFAKVVPQDRKLVLLGSMNGQYFGDNSGHLYDWLLEQGRMKPVWITRNRKLASWMRSQGQPVYLAWNLFALWSLIRARAVCFTNSLGDVVLSPRMIPRRCRVVYLTHDIAPKRSRHARLAHPLTDEALKRSRLENEMVTDYISSSPFITWCRAQALQVAEDKFTITGLPRNDILFRGRSNTAKEQLTKIIGWKPAKVILYAPTWRSGRDVTRLLPFEDLAIDVLQGILEEHDAALLFRCHKNELNNALVRSRLKELTDAGPRMIDATHQRISDLNTILPEVDVLISDYSGAVHDFLLLDRPIILVPYDIERFEQESGFFYDYRAMAPGPAVSTGSEFVQSLQAALAMPNEYKEKRARLRDLVFTHQDDSSCERVARLIESEL